MKKATLLLLILLAIPLAQASSLYTEDFSSANEKTFNLKEKDAVRFNIAGKETEMMLRSISPEKSSAKLTTFVEGAETPQYATIQTNSKLFLDLDRDNQKDVLIQAFYISKENTILSITNLEQGPALTGQATSNLAGNSGAPR